LPFAEDLIAAHYCAFDRRTPLRRQGRPRRRARLFRHRRRGARPAGERLLDLVQKARAAPSIEALDQIQVDFDHVVVAIIHQSEHEEYDQSVQMSFSLALDQVRFAIAGRRAMLLQQPGAEAKPGAKAAAA
jgi:hypothetical protein